MSLSNASHWLPGERLSDSLTRHGVSRREFVEYCGSLCVVLGVGKSAGARRWRGAPGATSRPPVIWLQLQECTGCVESVLRTAEPTIGDLVLDLDLARLQPHPDGGGRGTRRRRRMHDSMKANTGKYLLVVTGSVPLNEDGIYTHDRRPDRQGHPGGGGEGRRGHHRGRRLRPLGQRAGRAAQPHRRGGRRATSSRTSRS